MYSVDRYHDISCGHRVHGHESKCAHLHGHNYRIHFTAVPAPQEGRRFIGSSQARSAEGLDNIGRVVDFSVIKSKLCEWLEAEWDHKFLVWEMDPAKDALASVDPAGVVAVPFNPTAENMAEYLCNVVGPMMLRNTGARLVKVRIEETRKCAASYEVN